MKGSAYVLQGAFSVAVISSFKNSWRISEVSSVYSSLKVLLSFRAHSQFSSSSLRFFGKKEAKSLLVVPFFLNSYSPSVPSNIDLSGTSSNSSFVGDGGGGSVWYCSSGSSSFFLPFQRFFMLNQARSSVKGPVVLPATLVVSLVVSAALVSLSSLKAW